MTQANEPNQINLFSRKQLQDVRGTYHVQPGLGLTAAQIMAWQTKIHQYQQSLMNQAPPSQISLFPALDHATPASIPESDCLIQTLNPFTLRQQNTEFWRWQPITPGQPALYFVIDYQWPLLLYVGETLNDQQRWQGDHGCKQYLQNYVSALRTAQLGVSVGIGFWPGAAADRKARQAQERALILHWRSPFNKENWHYWQTPFIG